MADDNNGKLNPNCQIPFSYSIIFSGYYSAKAKYRSNQELKNHLFYEMENVKGIDYTRDKSHLNKNRYIEKYYKLSDSIEMIEEENKALKSYTDMIEKIFESISDGSLKEAIRQKYRFADINQ